MEEKKFEGKTKIIVNIDNINCADCALNIEKSVEHFRGLSAEVVRSLIRNRHYDLSGRVGSD
jgi:hypothetical protein